MDIQKPCWNGRSLHSAREANARRRTLLDDRSSIVTPAMMDTADTIS